MIKKYIEWLKEIRRDLKYAAFKSHGGLIIFFIIILIATSCMAFINISHNVYYNASDKSKRKCFSTFSAAGLDGVKIGKIYWIKTDQSCIKIKKGWILPEDKKEKGEDSNECYRIDFKDPFIASIFFKMIERKGEYYSYNYIHKGNISKSIWSSPVSMLKEYTKVDCSTVIEE